MSPVEGTPEPPGSRIGTTMVPTRAPNQRRTTRITPTIILALLAVPARALPDNGAGDRGERAAKAVEIAREEAGLYRLSLVGEAKEPPSSTGTLCSVVQPGTGARSTAPPSPSGPTADARRDRIDLQSGSRRTRTSASTALALPVARLGRSQGSAGVEAWRFARRAEADPRGPEAGRRRPGPPPAASHPRRRDHREVDDPPGGREGP